MTTTTTYRLSLHGTSNSWGKLADQTKANIHTQKSK